MKARKNPTDEQLMRRLRRAPESDRDPRTKNDPYWALRRQGFPHSYAKRVLRDQPPVIRQQEVSDDLGEYACDPDELLFLDQSSYTKIEVAMRPDLSEKAILELEPRASEYTVWDKNSPGLGVRIRSSGHMTYVVYYRSFVTRKLRKHTIGKIAEFSLDQAREAARAYRTAAREVSVRARGVNSGV